MPQHKLQLTVVHVLYGLLLWPSLSVLPQYGLKMNPLQSIFIGDRISSVWDLFCSPGNCKYCARLEAGTLNLLHQNSHGIPEGPSVICALIDTVV